MRCGERLSLLTTEPATLHSGTASPNIFWQMLRKLIHGFPSSVHPAGHRAYKSRFKILNIHTSNIIKFVPSLFKRVLKEYIVTRYKLRHDPKPPRLLENKDFHVEQMAANAADAAVCVFFWYSGATVWLVADESCTYVSICFHTQCMYENPSFLSYHLSFLVFFGTTHLT